MSLAVSLILNCTLDNREESGQLDWFCEKLLGSLFDRTHREIDRPVRGEHDERNGTIEFPQPGQEIEGRTVWKTVVQNGYRGARSAKHVKGVLTCLGLVDAVSLGFQKVANPETACHLVIDY